MTVNDCELFALALHVQMPLVKKSGDNKMKIRIACILGLLAASGCATGYQQAGFTGGFSEVPISATAYKISVSGNAFTRGSRVNEMALLRAAEIADENGYRFFQLLDMNEYTSISTYTSAGTSQTMTTGTAQISQFGSGARIAGQTNSMTTYSPPQTTEFVKPGVDIVVRFVPDEFAAQADALSVKQIYALYGEKYGLDLNLVER